MKQILHFFRKNTMKVHYYNQAFLLGQLKNQYKIPYIRIGQQDLTNEEI